MAAYTNYPRNVAGILALCLIHNVLPLPVCLAQQV